MQRPWGGTVPGEAKEQQGVPYAGAEGMGLGRSAGKEDGLELHRAIWEPLVTCGSWHLHLH